MKSDATRNLDVLSLDGGLADHAVVLHVTEIVLLAVHLVVQHVVVTLDRVLTNATN